MPGKSRYTVAIGAETYRDFSWELSDDEADSAIRCSVEDQARVQKENPSRIVIGVSREFVTVI